MDWDDLSPGPPQQTQQPQQSANQDNQQPPAASAPSWDDLTPGTPPSQQQAPEAQGALRSFARSAVRGAVPTAGGVAGAVAGAEAGAALGSLGGPLAPITIPAGSIAGLLYGGYKGAQLATSAQDAVTDTLGIGTPGQEEANEEAHPYATTAGDLLDTLVAFGTGNPTEGLVKAGGNKLVNWAANNPRKVAAGVFGATEAGKEAMSDDGVDLGKVALAAGAGAAAPTPRGWVTGLSDKAAAIAARFNKMAPRADTTAAQRTPDAQQTRDVTAAQSEPPKQNTGNAPAQPPPIDNPTVAAEVGNEGAAAGNKHVADGAQDERKPGAGGAQAGPGVVTQKTSPGMQTVDNPAEDPSIAAAMPSAKEPPQTEAPAAPANPPAQPGTGEATPTPVQPAAPPVAPSPAEVNATTAWENLHPGPPPGGVNTGITEAAANKPQPLHDATVAVTPGPGATTPINLGEFGKLQVPSHVAAALANNPEIVKALMGSRVDRDHYVPYTAGSSVNGGMTYIDHRVPRNMVLPAADGSGAMVPVPTTLPMILHEQIEKPIMQRLIAGGMEPAAAYKVAHWQFAEPLEDAYYQSRGVRTQDAEGWWATKQQQIENEGSAHPNQLAREIPSDLYKEPYPHDSTAHPFEGGVATQQPTEEELNAAHQILGTGQRPTEQPADVGTPKATAGAGNGQGGQGGNGAVPPGGANAGGGGAASPVPPKGAWDTLTNFLPSWLRTHVNSIINGRADIRDLAQQYQAYGLTPEERKQISDAHQTDTVDQLPDKLQEVYNKTIAPLLETHQELTQRAKALDNELHMGLDIGNLHEGVENNFLPRMRVEDPGAEPGGHVDPVEGRTLSSWQPALAKRDFDVLTDQNGQRVVFQRGAKNEDGDQQFKVYQNGKSSPLDAPKNWGGNVGDEVTVGGKKYTVDHAGTDEITAATNGKVKYENDAMLATANATNQLHSAVQNMELIKRIKDNRNENNSTVDKAAAKANDWIPTKLDALAKDPQGRTIYYPKDIAWRLDDFKGKDPGVWGKLGQELASAFMVPGSLIHVGNVGTQWAISRGFDWLPRNGNWQRLGRTGAQAIQEMANPGKIYKEMVDAGGSPMYTAKLTQDLIPDMKAALGTDIAQNPSKWDPIAKTWGITTPDLVHAVEKWTSKNMWKLAQVMEVQRYLELKEQGVGPKNAVLELQKLIPSYQMGPTIGPSNDIGRAIQQVLKNPAVSLFAPYHYNLFKAFGNITKDLRGSPADRNKAIGQLMMAGMLSYVVWPGLSKMLQAATGNDDAEVNQRGMLAITDAAQKALTGQKDYVNLIRNVFSPSVPLSAIMQLVGNRDYAGRQIVQQADLSSPGNAVRAAGQLGNFAAGEAFSPINTIGTAVNNQDWSNPVLAGLNTAGRFAGSMVGAHIPSEAEQKYLENQDKNNQKDYNTRLKHPRGLIEAGVNALTGE